MPVITINGTIGSGSVEVGHMVAEQMDINYVDRYVFAEAAKLVGSPVGALIDKEQKLVRFKERLGRFLQTMLERSAISGASGEPYFGRGAEMLPAEAYTELAGDSSFTQSVNDKAFIQATTSVVKDLARSGNVVIIGRGSNMILADFPAVVHIGMVAPLDVRVRTLMEREHFTSAEAHTYVEEVEQARLRFFRKFFKTNPNDASLYHLTLNMGKMDQNKAAEVIVHAAATLEH